MRKSAIVGFVIIVAATVYALAQGPAGPELVRVKWEYQSHVVDSRGNSGFDPKDSFESLGKDGWELVAVTPPAYHGNTNNPVDGRAYFKRQVQK